MPHDFPELREEGNPLWITFKFPGQGQQETPVADAREIVLIITLLPASEGIIAA